MLKMRRAKIAAKVMLLTGALLLPTVARAEVSEIDSQWQGMVVDVIDSQWQGLIVDFTRNMLDFIFGVLVRLLP